tara:strand:+ start:120 stop:503 length:384 start_codon:yes stop_codon:yes gene_type:complete
MLINTPISLGELLDKISILLIKKENIKDKSKSRLINNELKFLEQTLTKTKNKTKVQKYLKQLININSKLWVIEDTIREFESKKKFDKEFIKVARSVYKNNDKRAKIKLNINKAFGSKLIEVKSYKKY